MKNRMTEPNSPPKRAIHLNALVVVAGLLNAGCASESPGGPPGVSDLVVAKSASGPAVVDLSGQGANAYASAINAAGVIVGVIRSPSNFQAVLWDHGTLTELGPKCTTSGCDLSREGFPMAINGRGQVVGGWGLPEINAFEWDRGTLTDLGVGFGSYAGWFNDTGDILGAKNLCAGPFSHCQGTAVLWRGGIPFDLTFGGFSTPAGLNDAGQVVGEANRPVPGQQLGSGDEHAFLWEDGTMTDLGTLGGYTSGATGINSRGQVVGFAETSDYAMHAVLWDHGTMTDLGEGQACAINSAGQIVGESEGRAVVWDHGKKIDIGLSGYGTSISPLCLFLPFFNGPIFHGPIINAAGDVALNYCTWEDACSAYLWERNSLTKLDDVGGGQATVLGMNERGWMVGKSTTASGEVHAVMWTR